MRTLISYFFTLHRPPPKGSSIRPTLSAKRAFDSHSSILSHSFCAHCTTAFTRTPLFTLHSNTHLSSNSITHLSSNSIAHLSSHSIVQLISSSISHGALQSLPSWHKTMPLMTGVTNLDLAALQEYGRGHTPSMSLRIIDRCERCPPSSRSLSNSPGPSTDLGADVHFYDPLWTTRQGRRLLKPPQSSRAAGAWSVVPAFSMDVSRTAWQCYYRFFKDQIDWIVTIHLALGSIKPTQ